MADIVKPASTTQNLRDQKGTPVFPVSPERKAEITGGSVGEKHNLPIKKINAFLYALRDGYTKLTLEESVQNPTLAQVYEANKAKIIETATAVAKDGKAFDMQSCPLALTNNEKNKLWPMAVEILKNLAKYGVNNGFSGFQKFKPLGRDSSLAPPQK